MKAIITDYDYTLSDKFMTVELLLLLEKLKIIKSGYAKEYQELRQGYVDKSVKYNDFVKNDMNFIRKYLKGVAYSDVRKVIQQELKPEKNLLNWSKEIRKIFKKDEWLFIVISSTMGDCLEKVQELLDFDTYLASRYEIKDRAFTGEFSCQIKKEEKADYVRKIKPSFEKIIVVGDAPGDFGMMEHADKAFLFEPDENTLSELKNSSFEIVNRENVLQKLKQFI